MIDALFNNANYVAAKKLLDATMLRHEAIASNLANLETPGYRRVDIEPTFNAELKQALATGDASQISALEPKLQVDPNAVAQSRDGNTVNLESEDGQPAAEHPVPRAGDAVDQLGDGATADRD